MKTLTPRALLSLLLLFCVTFQSLAQNWSLGPYQFLSDASYSRKQKALLHFATIGTFATHSRVRGVVFEQTASMADGIDAVSISYDPNAADGSRLIVTINNSQDYHAKIFDWQLLPTANFADDSHTSLADMSLDSIFTHPSITDQLLGIRTIQADVIPRMAMEYYYYGDESYAEGMSGFMRYNERTIKGSGEALLSEALLERSRINARALGSLVYNSGANVSMLTDHGLDITLSVDNGEIVMTGAPYFLLTHVDMKKKTVTLLWPDLNDTEEITLTSECFRKINPYVFNSMKCLSNFSALFRYVKENDPDNWNEFLASIPDADSIRPQVITPHEQGSDR